jgi:hypothetical protein
MQILGRFTWLTENSFNISNRRPGIHVETQDQVKKKGLFSSYLGVGVCVSLFYVIDTGSIRVRPTGEIHLNWTHLNDRYLTWTDLNWPDLKKLTWTELLKKTGVFRSKNGRFWGVLGRFWGVFGAFWGDLGRFWAFWGVFWAFLGVYAGPKNATPFFWPTELNWAHYWQVQIFLTWTELNDLISVQFRISGVFLIFTNTWKCRGY